MADSTDLMRLLQAKHEAVRAYREASDDEGRAKAWDGVDAASKALDAELVAREESRELEAQIAAEEARNVAAKSVDDSAVKQAGHLPVEDIRAFARGERNRLEVTIPFGKTGEQRTDMVTSDSTVYAQYTVPQTWADNVVNFQIAASGLLQAKPTVITTAGGNQINMGVLKTDATAVAGTEGTAASVTNVVFDTAVLNAYRFDGFFSVSNELLDDTGVPLESLLATYAGRALAAKVNPYFVDPDVGTGSSTIQAIQVGCTAGKTAAAYTGVTVDEIKELMYSVLPVYRKSPGAAFVANSAVTLSTALARDDNGAFLWQPSLMASEPDRFQGYPWFEDAYMDTLATANEPIVFGDVGASYMVRYGHGGMQFIADKSFAVTSFETTFVWGIWVDAVVVDTLAVKSILLP